MYAPLRITDLELPWGRMWEMSVPGHDVKFQKQFVIDLTAWGGADPNALIRIGVGTKADPKDRIQVYTLELVPRDNFSERNVVVELLAYVHGQQSDYKPAHKAQQTNDAAVVSDRMQAIDIFLDNEHGLGISFTNLSAAGAAGYTGTITGRLYREVN